MIHEDFEGICEESISFGSFYIERYISKEDIEFFSEYMSKENFVEVPDKCSHSCRLISKSSKGIHVVSKCRQEALHAHLYILNNIHDVLPYLTKHKHKVKNKNPRQLEK